MKIALNSSMLMDLLSYKAANKLYTVIKFNKLKYFCPSLYSRSLISVFYQISNARNVKFSVRFKRFKWNFSVIPFS